MNPRKLVVAILFAAAAAAAIGAMRTTAAARTAAVARARAEDARRRDADIAFFLRRVAADPIGAADRARLAALYLQRGRETGDFEDYRRAEALARRSLELRVAHNARTYVVLASALLAQHRFTEALAAARDLNARDPGVAFVQRGNAWIAWLGMTSAFMTLPSWKVISSESMAASSLT